MEDRDLYFVLRTLPFASEGVVGSCGVEISNLKISDLNVRQRQSTKFISTKLKAQSSKHKAQGTKLKARGLQRRSNNLRQFLSLPSSACPRFFTRRELCAI